MSVGSSLHLNKSEMSGKSNEEEPTVPRVSKLTTLKQIKNCLLSHPAPLVRTISVLMATACML